MNSSFRARCSDQQLLLRRFQIAKALRPGIEPDLRASKAHVATTRRRELSNFKECPVGVEPTYPDWKSGTFAARPRTLECGSLKGEV